MYRTSDVSCLKIAKALGRAIRARRESLGLSQEELAAGAGVHRTYLGAIERGERNPSLRNICRIARALSIPLSVLLGEAEPLASKGVAERGGNK